MEIRSATGAEAGAAPASSTGATQVREALGDVLQSAPFRNSRQCQTFLTYIIERTLNGENELLRERVIGTEVFGRNADYDPSDDPIVRVRAAEVRKRLAQYYQNHAGSPVQIEIPPGSYKAVFQWKAGDETPREGAGPRRLGPRWLQVALAITALGGLALVARGLLSPAPTAMDQFWTPALTSPKPVLIYNATRTLLTALEPAGSSPGLASATEQYTWIGDASVSVALGSLFAGKGKLYQMRYGSDISFGDLRYQPSILIGAFNNSWTLQTTNELRFVFDRPPSIRDRQENRTYTVPLPPPGERPSEDYAIVARVFDSKTGELLIAAAGITQYGTRAAGEFLTSPQLMTALAAKAPAGWPKKNVQVLLRTRIVGETSGPPAILKTYFW